MRHELGETSVITWKILLKSILTSIQCNMSNDVLQTTKIYLLALVLVPSLSTILNMMSALIGTSQTPSL